MPRFPPKCLGDAYVRSRSKRGAPWPKSPKGSLTARMFRRATTSSCMMNWQDLVFASLHRASAATSPCCLAAGAMPGTSHPSGVMIAAVSPMMKIAGCPCSVRSGCTGTRPARSPSNPSHAAAGDAAPPAAQTAVRQGMNSWPMHRPSALISATGWPSRS